MISLPENFKHSWVICHFTGQRGRCKNDITFPKPLLFLRYFTRTLILLGPHYRCGSERSVVCPRPHSKWMAEPEFPRRSFSPPYTILPSQLGSRSSSKEEDVAHSGELSHFNVLPAHMKSLLPSPPTFLPSEVPPFLVLYWVPAPSTSPPARYIRVSQCYLTCFSFAAPHKEYF